MVPPKVAQCSQGGDTSHPVQYQYYYTTEPNGTTTEPNSTTTEPDGTTTETDGTVVDNQSRQFSTWQGTAC